MRTKKKLFTPLTFCAISSKGSFVFASRVVPFLVFLTSSTPGQRWWEWFEKAHWFCLFQSNNPIILGPDNSNLPKIFLIIADGVANESIKSEDVCSKRLANVIRQVQVSCWCQQLDFQETPSAGSNLLFLLGCLNIGALNHFERSTFDSGSCVLTNSAANE